MQYGAWTRDMLRAPTQESQQPHALTDLPLTAAQTNNATGKKLPGVIPWRSCCQPDGSDGEESWCNLASGGPCPAPQHRRAAFSSFDAAETDFIDSAAAQDDTHCIDCARSVDFTVPC